MQTSLLHGLCAGRMAQTGELQNTVLSELRRIPSGGPPIPEAASADQAFLESCFMEAIGHCGKDRWRPHMLAFAVTSVTPRPDELIVRIPAEYLRDVLPAWARDGPQEEEPDQIYGIPGLRARFHRGRIVLSRPGFPGRVSIPAPAGRWHKAALVAADLSRWEGSVWMPWLTHPEQWHPQETRWVQAYSRRYSPGSWQYRNSRFASQILRRLPGLCPLPRAYSRDLWLNRFGDTCSIEFEWFSGPAHSTVLDRILDPVFGPGGEIELLDGQTVASCHAGAHYAVKVRCIRQPGTWIALRRAAWETRPGDEDITRTFGAERRRFREAVEKKHGYDA